MLALVLSACGPGLILPTGPMASTTPTAPALGLDSASSGLCDAAAGLPDRVAVERAFTNDAHDALHLLAAEPRLSRSISGRVLETMDRVEMDFDDSADPAVLEADLAALGTATDEALGVLGIDVPACPR